MNSQVYDLCIRPPCENCGADYDSCWPACPECGHPNEYGLPELSMPKFQIEKKEVYCKICKKTHTVEKLVPDNIFAHALGV